MADLTNILSDNPTQWEEKSEKKDWITSLLSDDTSKHSAPAWLWTLEDGSVILADWTKLRSAN